MAVTPPLPAIQCVERDKVGNCVFDHSRKPAKRVHDLHTERAFEIYRPYFVCYYDRLTSDDDFGTSDGEKATAAMESARRKCGTRRVTAEKAMDRYLTDRKIYGDAANRRFVRELFRREGGGSFVLTTARANGHGDAFETMSNAMAKEQLASDD